MSTRKLAMRIVAMAETPDPHRQATVTKVNDGPPKSVDIVLGGDPRPGCRYLASYTPTVGDSVRVLQSGGDLLVLGNLA